MVEHKDAFGSVCIPDDWSLIPLGKCVTEKLSYGINAPAIPFDGKAPAYIRITDITEDGRFDNSDRKAVQTQERDKYLLREGDIVLARTGASTGKSYLYDERDGELVYAGFLIKASIDVEQHNPRFIVGQLRTPRYWSWVAAMSMRSGQPGINGKEYSSFLVPVAPKKEQDAIANTLSEFDTHIANLAELIEKKKAIRDGAVEDLVSGRTRLAGFVKPWEEVELGRVGTFTKGAPLSKAHISNTGTPFILYGELYTTYHEVTYKVYRHTDESVADEYYSRVGDVIIPTSGETAEEIATSCCVMVPGVILAGDLNIYRSSEFDGRFLSYVINHIVNRQISELAQGISIIHINAKTLKRITVRYPEKEEQAAIADIIDTMDDEITALEDERNKMIQIREGAMDDLLTGRVRLAM